MPHERIQPLDTPDIDVNVAWGRDAGYVQVSTTTEHPERIALWREAIETTTRDGVSLTLGLHAELDRPRINELIRVLRRARDAAFGRDE